MCESTGASKKFKEEKQMRMYVRLAFTYSSSPAVLEEEVSKKFFCALDFIFHFL